MGGGSNNEGEAKATGGSAAGQVNAGGEQNDVVERVTHSEVEARRNTRDGSPAPSTQADEMSLVGSGEVLAVESAKPSLGNEEEEYPAQPTMFYFAVKFLIGLLTFAVVAVAIYFRPSPCEGVCWMEKEGTAVCGPKNPLKLVFHRIEGSTDEQFLHFAREAQARKGFSWLSVGAGRSSISVSPGSDLESVADLHIRLKEAVDHIPWKLATRSNHTLFEGSIPVIDWSSTLSKRVASIGLVRNPRDRLRAIYEKTIAQLSHEGTKLFQKLTSLETKPSFEECLLDDKCSEAMQFAQSCQSQTVAFCGIDCMILPSGKLTEEKLEKARLNLKQFLLVGIVEDPAAIASFLRISLPTYFEFLPSNFTLGVRPNSFEYSRTATKKLDEICKFDDALYAAAVEEFRARGNECTIKVEDVPVHTSKSRFSIW